MRCISSMLLFILGIPLFGQSYRLLYSVIDNGSGKCEMTDYILNDAVGQSVTGKSDGAGYNEYVGFFHPLKSVIGIEEDEAIKKRPTIFSLSPVFPNPARTFAAVRYGIPKDTDVEITIYNLSGQKVATLVAEHKKTGYHTVRWDGTDDSGKRVALGIYFYRLDAGDFKATRKLTILR